MDIINTMYLHPMSSGLGYYKGIVINYLHVSPEVACGAVSTKVDLLPLMDILVYFIYSFVHMHIQIF